MRARGADAGRAAVDRPPSTRRCRPPLPLHRLAADRRRASCPFDAGPDRAGRRRTERRRRGGPGSRADAPQRVGPASALGRGGFADDTAPADALVAVLDADGEWVVGETLAEARRRGRQGPGPAHDGAADVAARRCRRATGTRTLRTTWVEPGYLEPDASWCAPGGEPATPLANGGAFGGKLAVRGRRRRPAPGRRARPAGPRPARARGRRAPRAEAPADRGRRPRRRHAVSSGSPARRASPTAIARRSRPASRSRRSTSPGRRRRRALRGAGLGRGGRAAAPRSPTAPDTVAHRPTARPPSATVDDDGVHVARALRRPARRGRAAQLLHRRRPHGARLGALARASPSTTTACPVDLTIRSFGILRAVDMPPIDVEIEPDDGPPVNGSDAVFAAVAAAAWRARRLPADAGPSRDADDR